MQCKEIMQVIEATYPRTAALDFDNVGLLAGRADKEVNRVYLALDATDRVIERAIEAGADMLITHHPLLFSAVKKVTDEDFITRRIVKLIQNDISYYAMHTNYDVAKMAELAGARLHLQNQVPLEQTGCVDGVPYGIGCIGEFGMELTAQECCQLVKEAFQLPHVRLFGEKGTKIKKAAVCPGSGKSMIGEALAGGAQIYITGDIGHHDGLDAMDQGLSIIDAGHYGIEQIFIPHMEAWMKTNFGELEVKRAKQGEPFEVI